MDMLVEELLARNCIGRTAPEELDGIEKREPVGMFAAERADDLVNSAISPEAKCIQIAGDAEVLAGAICVADSGQASSHPVMEFRIVAIDLFTFCIAFE